VKKTLHFLTLILAGLLAAGILHALLSPVPRPSGPASESVAAPPVGRVALLLGPSPAGPAERSSRNEFAFGETIYATVAIEEVEPGDHVLAFRWINPRDGVQEGFRKSFYSRGGSYRGWSWLELQGEEWLGFPLGPLGPGRFLGRWRVEVELDSAFLAQAEFAVR
jgi:hypothetical protein